ncbi:hypothetical protein D3C81_2237130 [compost metagenome]
MYRTALAIQQAGLGKYEGSSAEANELDALGVSQLKVVQQLAGDALLRVDRAAHYRDVVIGARVAEERLGLDPIATARWYRLP